MKSLLIHESDSVRVALHDLKKGEEEAGIILKEDIKTAHKFAIKDIKKGENIYKYGYPIGHAKVDIAKGSWVHTHNVETNLSSELEYTYKPNKVEIKPLPKREVYLYKRENDTYGIRNNLLIVPLVGCVNGQAERIKERLLKEGNLKNVDDIIVLKHPFGCSQMGDDKTFTERILQKCVVHPNAGGVLILSLGCEENRMEPFLEGLSDIINHELKP